MGQHQLGRLPLPWHALVWEDEGGSLYDAAGGIGEGEPACVWERLPVDDRSPERSVESVE